MNKLMGFYELKDMDLPSVQWKEYQGLESLDENMLWTIRCAVFSGNDLSLPRLVGADSEKATHFANLLLEEYKDKGIVIFYPYFIADKSGTLNIYLDKVVIEAVEKDLWNLVTYSKKNITIQITDRVESYDGDKNFLTILEREQLLSYVVALKRAFREDLMEGKSLLLEWSYARNCNLKKQPIGEAYLIFYEIRTI